MNSLLGPRRQSIKLIFVTVAIVILVGSLLFSLVLRYQSVYPRNLQVGDRWTYSILFPDSNELASPSLCVLAADTPQRSTQAANFMAAN
jgi:hypothetical protein